MLSRKPHFILTAVAAVIGIFSINHARAATIQDTYSYVTDQTAYTASAGQTVTVGVYLKETVVTTSILAANTENGLSGAGFAVNRSATGLPSNPSAFSANPTPDTTHFDGTAAGFPPIVSFTASKDTLSESASPSDTSGVQLGNPGSTGVTPSNEVFLGTLTITAGQTAGTTTFNVGELNTAGGNTITFANGYDLDKSRSSAPAYTGVGTGVTPFDVTVTPEPASMALAAIGGLVLLSRRRRIG